MSETIALRPDRIWVLAAVIMMMIHVVAVLALPSPDCDFHVFYLGARSLLQEGSPYVLQPSDLGLEVKAYAYPPLLAALMTPFSLFEVGVATRLWMALNFGATVLVGFMLAAAAGRVSLANGVLWIGVLCFSVHQMVGNSIGQVHNVVALLILGGIVGGPRWRALWGLAAALKLFPAVMVVVDLLRRRIGAGLGFLVAASLPFLLLGSSTLSWVRDVLMGPAMPLALNSQHVMSVAPVGARLFLPTRFAVPVAEIPWAATLVTVVLMAMVVSAVVWVFRATRDESLRIAAALLGSMLCFPGLGSYHWSLAVVAVVLILSAAPEEGAFWTLRRGPALRWCGAAMVLLILPVDYGVAAPEPGTTAAMVRTFFHVGFGTLLMSPHLVGLCFLLVACVVEARRRSG